MIGNLGPLEVLVIGGAIVLLFGHKRIPDLAKGLGQGLRVFRKEVTQKEPREPKKPLPNE